MTQTIDVTFTTNAPTPYGGPQPGSWSYSPGPSVQVDSGTTVTVLYQLTASTSSGWGFQSASLSGSASGPSAGTIDVTTQTPMPTPEYPYNGFTLKFESFSNTQIEIQVTNDLTEEQDQVTLGLNLTVGNDDGEKQTSPDPQIVLLPKGD